MGKLLDQFKEEWMEEHGETVYLTCLGNILSEQHQYAFQGWLLGKGLQEYEDDEDGQERLD